MSSVLKRPMLVLTLGFIPGLIITMMACHPATKAKLFNSKVMVPYADGLSIKLPNESPLSCGSAQALKFAIVRLTPSVDDVGCAPFCGVIGKTIEGIEVSTHPLFTRKKLSRRIKERIKRMFLKEDSSPASRFKEVQLLAQGTPCRKSKRGGVERGQDAIECCNLDLHIRPAATDGIVMLQILYDLEFKFLLPDRLQFWMPAKCMHDVVSPENIKFILDAGGNCGMSAVHFASLYPDATIVTVEPDLTNFGILLKNVAAFPNIHAVNKGMWNKDVKLKVVEGNRGIGEFGFQVFETNADDMEAIQGTSVDALLRQFNLPRFDMIKMDIEGSEKEVFEGDTVQDWLPEVSIFFAELHPDMRPGCDDAVRALLRNERYYEVLQGEYEVYVKKY